MSRTWETMGASSDAWLEGRLGPVVDVRVKIRYKTWYWGKWIWSGSSLDGSIVTTETEGFELYFEGAHGWQNSEEFKNGLG